MMIRANPARDPHRSGAKKIRKYFYGNSIVMQSGHHVNLVWAPIAAKMENQGKKCDKKLLYRPPDLVFLCQPRKSHYRGWLGVLPMTCHSQPRFARWRRTPGHAVDRRRSHQDARAY